MRMILKKEFFERSVLAVASDLLGKCLVREVDGEKRACMITETEAYDGENDLACHASRGRTARTEVMYGEAGVFYVYLVYGMHNMLNIVTGEKGYPAAVLIRGVRGMEDGADIEGPGRLTRFLTINRNMNGKSALPEIGLWFEDRGIVIPSRKIKKTSRIGVAYAGAWADKKYRFLLANF